MRQFFVVVVVVEARCAPSFFDDWRVSEESESESEAPRPPWSKPRAILVVCYLGSRGRLISRRFGFYYIMDIDARRPAPRSDA